jgi:hypothetical protein
VPAFGSKNRATYYKKKIIYPVPVLSILGGEGATAASGSEPKNQWRVNRSIGGPSVVGHNETDIVLQLSGEFKGAFHFALVSRDDLQIFQRFL